jgi:hypothetical protein
MTAPDSQTYEAVARFLNAEISLADLQRQMLRIAMRLSDVEVAQNNPVAGKVALYLDEYALGDRTEQEIKKLLRDITTTMRLEVSPPADLWLALVDAVGRSSAKTTEEFFEADTPLGEGFERQPSQSPQTGHRTTTALLDPSDSR